MLYCCPGVQVWKIGIVDGVLNCIFNIDKARGEDLRNQSLEKRPFLMRGVRNGA